MQLCCFCKASHGKRKYFAPLLNVSKTIIYKNCVCIPVALGHTYPLYRCIVHPLRGETRYLRNAALQTWRNVTKLSCKTHLPKTLDAVISKLQGWRIHLKAGNLQEELGKLEYMPLIVFNDTTCVTYTCVAFLPDYSEELCNGLKTKCKNIGSWDVVLKLNI